MQFRVAIKAILLLPLISVLAACGAQSGASANDATQTAERAKIECADGTSVAWNKTCPVVTPVSAPVVSAVVTPVSAPVLSAAVAATYDSSVGTGVDGDGFALLPLRAGASRFFVNSIAGADANGCSNAQQPTKPLKTIAAAIACIQDYSGSGDQVLLAEGMKYPEALPWLGFKGGSTAQYPTVIQSYDPADPLNQAKYGRGDQRSARPVLTAPQKQVGNGIYSYLAIRGLDFNPGNVAGPNLIFVGQSNYILVENNLFRFTGLSFDKGDQAQASHHVVRYNSFYGQWNTGGRAGGIYDAGTDGVTLEDNVFWHNGWRVGGSRDDDASVGGATIYSHTFYLQTNTGSAVIRRNLTMDASGDGGTARGDITFTENVSIDNPWCISLGGGPTYNTDRPNGVIIEASYNACFGDADVTSSHALGWGIVTVNGKAGSRVHHNLIARSRDPNNSEMTGFSNYAAYNQPSYAQYDHNLMFKWINPTRSPYYPAGGAFPAQTLTTYDYNIWDGAPQGTNTSSAAMSFPNPYTATQLYSALGCTDKPTCAARMIETPELRWGTRTRGLLFAGYGL